MRILFVADVSIQKVIGGAERVLFEQATGLARRDHDIHVLTRRIPEHASDHEVIQGVHEWRYPVSNGNELFFLRSILNEGRKRFEALNGRFCYDFINFQQPFSAYAVLQAPGARSTRKVYTCHSLSFEEFKSRNAAPREPVKMLAYQLGIRVRRSIEKKAIAGCDRISVLSRYTREKLWDSYRIPAEKVDVIPGGIDLKRFSPVSSYAVRRDMRRAFGLPEDRPILFTVRNLVPRMGLENLLQAMKVVLAGIPEVTLVIGGNGPLREKLAVLSRDLGIEERVIFAGFIPEEDLPDFYRMSDLFVLPTAELEGFGLVTLEALASGVPVLGTPVGGTQEILSRLHGRFLFRDSTPLSMAEGILGTVRKMGEDPAFAKDLAGHCRHFAENHYSWEKNIAATERLFLELLGNSAVQGATLPGSGKTQREDRDV